MKLILPLKNNYQIKTKMSFKPIYKLRDWINPELIITNALYHNPAALHIIEQNLDKIDWYFLSCIPVAIHILEKNQDKINWENLSENPAIFVLDTNAMRKQIDNGFAEELISTALHPRHFERNLIQYGYDIGLNEYTGFD